MSGRKHYSRRSQTAATRRAEASKKAWWHAAGSSSTSQGAPLEEARVLSSLRNLHAAREGSLATGGAVSSRSSKIDFPACLLPAEVNHLVGVATNLIQSSHHVQESSKNSTKGIEALIKLVVGDFYTSTADHQALEKECQRLRATLLAERMECDAIKDLLHRASERCEVLKQENRIWTELEEKSFKGLEDLSNQKIKLLEDLATLGEAIKKLQREKAELQSTWSESIVALERCSKSAHAIMLFHDAKISTSGASMPNTWGKDSPHVFLKKK